MQVALCLVALFIKFSDCQRKHDGSTFRCFVQLCSVVSRPMASILLLFSMLQGSFLEIHRAFLGEAKYPKYLHSFIKSHSEAILVVWSSEISWDVGNLLCIKLRFANFALDTIQRLLQTQEIRYSYRSNP